MKLKFIALFLFLMAPVCCFATTDSEQTSEQKKYIEWANKIWNSLNRQTGEIELPNKVANLNIPEGFYYLDPEDSDKILVDVWGNPPGQKTLGMIFPADTTPFHPDSWGVTIDYSEDGYVSDKDADKINYDKLLKSMKKSVAEESKLRIEKGYDSIELVGWAAKPYYDSKNHKLYWAKEFRFGDSDENTLNYNIRVLGRKGVLILNFISSMQSKATIESQLDKVLAVANFNQGYTYAEFNPKLDKVAAYGIGALVAGKLAAKTGLIAASLIFLKKFGIIALVFFKKFGIFLVVGIGAFIKKLFGKKEA